jgi:hypothetical protein
LGRRADEGKSNSESIRGLERFIAREVHRVSHCATAHLLPATTSHRENVTLYNLKGAVAITVAVLDWHRRIRD